MKIIRWILSHTFLILLIVVVIYGYMFWGNLLGKDTPAGKAVAYLSSEFVVIDEFVNAVKAKQAGLQSAGSQGPDSASGQAVEPGSEVSSVVSEAATAEVVEERNDSDVSVEAGTAPDTDSSTDAGQNTGSIAVAGNTGDSDGQTAQIDEAQAVQAGAGSTGLSASVSQDSDIQDAGDQGASSQGTIQRQAVVNDEQLMSEQQLVEQTDSDSVETAAAADVSSSTESMNAANDAEAFVSPEIEKQLDNVDDSGRVIDEKQKIAAVRDTWITARKSFYQRKYELSEQSYQDVINSTRDNHDAYGELGNVYFNQGKHKQAAAAYYQAAAILVKKGQVNRARSLVGLLRHLDESKASELQQLIESAAS